MNVQMPIRKAAIGAAICLGLAACASASGGKVSSVHGSLTYGVLMPFSGPSAPDGVQTLNGCLVAAHAIDLSGGILGHQVYCKEFDTRSDPVDTVPAARQMLSTTSNLVGVFGPDSGEAVPVTPLLEKAKMTMFSVAGDPYYDNNPSPYFYRMQPSDDWQAESLVVHAKDVGYHRIALVFTTDGSAQTNDPPMVLAAKKLGLTIVANQQILADQSSYRSQVAALIASHPQAIVTETDPQSAGTYYSELAQAGGLVPMIVTGEASYPAWQTAIRQAIGQSAMQRLVSAVWAVADPTGPGWQAYAHYIVNTKGTDPKEFTTDLYARSQYDGGILMALAMTKAKNFSPAVYNKYIREFLQPGSNKTVVHDYAEGVAALKAGKDIYYEGALGPIKMNRYDNVETAMGIQIWEPNATFKQIGAVPNQEIEAIALR
jgi:ABC-type branched-subunit amino acid transport system substrate-binding protein